MADEEKNEKWLQGKSPLFKSRAERVKADMARRKAGRKFIKAEDVKLEWEAQNGVWMGPLVSQELGFENRIIEVDCHIYPPHSRSITHKHNEAIIIVLRGRGYSRLDEERIDWKAGDTLYIGQGVWHQHSVTSDEPVIVTDYPKDIKPFTCASAMTIKRPRHGRPGAESRRDHRRQPREERYDVLLQPLRDLLGNQRPQPPRAQGADVVVGDIGDLGDKKLRVPGCPFDDGE